MKKILNKFNYLEVVIDYNIDNWRLNISSATRVNNRNYYINLNFLLKLDNIV